MNTRQNLAMRKFKIDIDEKILCFSSLNLNMMHLNTRLREDRTMTTIHVRSKFPTKEIVSEELNH